MVELHGWMSVSATYGNEDMLSDSRLNEIMDQVDSILKGSSFDIKLKYMNGIPYINTSFSSNHRTGEADDIISVYKQIAEAATGSYGVIYLRDDEDKKHHNDMMRYVFKRGGMTVVIDGDFSPCIPQLEDGD